MADSIAMALEVTRALRASKGYKQLGSHQARALEEDLRRIESRLGRDPYAQVLGPGDPLWKDATIGSTRPANGTPAPAPPAPLPAPPPPTSVIGQRAADALQAVNFPGFVSSLLTGTFQAIVDASAQQVREYAKLVASITQSQEEFCDQNVTPNQARDHLAQQYSNDLMIAFPAPGTSGQPRLLPRPDRVGESPVWLEKFNLGGEELREELTEGPLLEHGRRRVGEDRLQTLATMVLMGINRVVVNEGDVRAKLQFHATAVETQHAELQMQGASIAGRNVNADTNTTMMVSTLKVNAQADSGIKADLMGEVRISFRSETFPLERFADSAAIQLLSKHARWRSDVAQVAPPSGSAAPAPAAVSPTTTPAPPAAGPRGGTNP